MNGGRPKREKEGKAFNDISKYFTKEEWAGMTSSKKTTYVYMKRNYDTMTKLGLKAVCPSFMKQVRKDNSNNDNYVDTEDEHSKMDFNVQPSKKLKEVSKDENEASQTAVLMEATGSRYPTRASRQQNKPVLKEKETNIQTYALRERKGHVVYEEPSDTEEDEDDDDLYI
ncbi:putative protein SSX9 isoform X1 [Echinops telfairi]|uniref:Uncharacterized protein n=1 Tax=Echinops telfairi TaxID=9371 RepID=A0AC55CXQ0_ECHTE|nr:putative protein SSX9 isoform X1 [Echinops telfairi]